MATLRNHGWLSRKIFRRQKAARRKTPYGCQLGFETLEERQLLSISWTNRGVTTGDDNDRFDLVFGPLAGQARSVVEASIDFWERSINSFNYGDGGNDIYEMKIQMNEIPSLAGSNPGATAGFTHTRNGKPSKGAMTINWLFGVTPGANTAAGYYLDPTPYESSEFQGGILNAFVGQPTAALGGSDLFTLSLHEMGHAMGLGANAQNSAQSVDTEYSDTVNMPASVPPSTLWLYDNGNGSLWTEWNSAAGVAGGTPTNAAGPSHFAPQGTSAVRLGVTYSGAFALMNASVTSRSIISDIEMDAAARVFGYITTPPSRYGTTYGQLDADGTLRIDTGSLGISADAITLSGSGGVLSLTLDTGAPIAGIDPTGAILSQFDSSAVQRIEINTGAGADTITIGQGVIDTRIIGGTGGAYTDTLIVSGATGTNGLTSATFTGGSHNITSINGIENMVINGTNGNENFFVSGTPAPGFVTINAGNGTNNLFIGGGDLAAYIPSLTAFTYNGGSGGDGLIVSNQNNNSLTWVNEIFPGSADFFAAGYFLNINYSSVEAVTIEGSQRNDQFVVAAGSPNTVTLNGYAGNDSFNVGGGDLLSSAGLANMNGGLDNDTLILNDTLSTHNLPWTINGATGLSTANRIFLGINEYSYGGFESVGVLGGTIGQEFRITGTLSVGLNIDGGGGGDTMIVGFQTKAQFLAPVTINGGPGNDNYQWTRGSNNWYQGFLDINLYDVLLDGGTGYNTLAIDETTRSAAGYYLYADRFYATDGAVFPVGFDIDYDNMLAMSFSAGGGTTNVGVYGTSSDIDVGNQISMSLGGGNDNIYLYPHDAQGNLTINGNVGLGGGPGTDNLYVDDSASSSPAAYVFANPFGAGTQNITGVGSGGFGIANDFEAITMTGSVGDDVYNISSYKSGMGLTINGGFGDDVCNFGNGDVAANVTNIASFLFNGMEGADTFNLRNASPANSFTYTAAANTTLQVSRTFPSSYFLSLEYYNTEQKAIYAGPAVDIMNITSFASGELSFHGAGGDDALNPPTSSDLLGRRVNFFGDAGTANRINQIANGKTAPSTLHVAQNTIGAFPGDDFFAPGGSLFFDSVQIIQLRMGSGADTAYMQPDAVAAISIIGGNPTTAPGDNFRLSLAGVTNPVFTPGGTGAGTYSFTGAQPVSYTGFESNVAAYPGDFDLDGTVGQADHALWKAAFGMNVVPGTSGDANWNGIVDAADYVVWRKNLGASIPGAGVGSGAMASTSEPTARASQPPALPGVRAAQTSTIVSTSTFATLQTKPPAEPATADLRSRAVAPDHVAARIVELASPRRENHALRPGLSDVPPARRDEALVAWLASRPSEGLVPVFDEALRLSDESLADSAAASYKCVDAVFEELAAVSL